jgi:hypothetical protein
VVDEWDELKLLLNHLANHPEEIQACSQNARKLARKHYSGPHSHPQLAHFLRTLRRRNGHESLIDHASCTFREQEEQLVSLSQNNAGMMDENKRLLKEIERLQGELAINHLDAESFRSLRQKLPYRLWKKLLG